MGLGSEIWDQEKIYPGSRGQKGTGTGSWIRNTVYCTCFSKTGYANISQCVISLKIRYRTYTADAVHLHSELSSQYGVLTSYLKKKRKITNYLLMHRCFLSCGRAKPIIRDFEGFF
jgi:hypothetical protein